MKRSTNKDLDVLDRTTAKLCISLYVPTHSGATNQQIDAVAFKKILKQLDSKLDSIKFKMSDRTRVISRVEKVLNHELLKRRNGSIALFYDTKTLRGYFIDGYVKPTVKFGTKFDIMPLLLFRLTSTEFIIVTLSQKTVEVFRCTAGSIKKLPMGGYRADSLEKELKLDEIFRNIQTHPSSKGGSRESAGVHGQGSFKDEHKKLIKQYFRKIDSNIAQIINHTDLQVILAGVGFLLPIYREVSKIKKIHHKEIHGNPQKLSSKELLRRAIGVLD